MTGGDSVEHASEVTIILPVSSSTLALFETSSCSLIGEQKFLILKIKDSKEENIAIVKSAQPL